jgi:hypothetical protein
MGFLFLAVSNVLLELRSEREVANKEGAGGVPRVIRGARREKSLDSNQIIGSRLFRPPNCLAMPDGARWSGNLG